MPEFSLHRWQYWKLSRESFLSDHSFVLAVLILNPAQVESKPAVAEKANHSAIQNNSLVSNLPQTETSESQIKAELGFSISSAYQSQKPFSNKLNSSKGTKRGIWIIGWLLYAQTCRFSPLAWASKISHSVLKPTHQAERWANVSLLVGCSCFISDSLEVREGREL